MHLAPVQGRARDVGDAIVRAMFPAGSDGRIPTVAVTGTNGKTTVARLTAHLLAGTGLRVGLTSTDGVCIDGRLIQRADATGPRSAQMVLGDPAVEAAVLETARGGMLRRGLGYDWTDVGVITNITADHLGQDGIDIDRGPRARQGARRRAGPGRRHARAQRRRPVGAQPGRAAPGACGPQADRLVRPRPAATR